MDKIIFNSPSPEWTPEERLEMIGKLVATLRTDTLHPYLTYLERLERTERACLLATAHTSFLEQHKTRILGGI